MGTRENKNAKIANLRHPRKFKPAKIRARTVFKRGKPSASGYYSRHLLQKSTKKIKDKRLGRKNECNIINTINHEKM